jgi:drug/metabolite transporter (DMT)-like permease
VLFGSTFVVVKSAVAESGPIPFLAARFLFGGLVLLPLARRDHSQPGELRAGVWCGLSLLAGYVFQTVGLQYTSASVSAFITYLLVVIVPVISAFTLRRAPRSATVAGIVVATAGLFLLSGGTTHLGRGELLTLGCAVCFAVHVVLVAEYAPRYSILRLTAVQLLVVGGACLVPGAFLGGYRFGASAWFAAIYTAVGVSALALLLQSWGQRRVGPSHASLLLMIEPVAAAVLGWLLHEHLGGRGIVGAALILAGIAISEIRLFGPRRHLRIES